MSHGVGLGLLPLLWSCGPAQAVSLFSVPYNLAYIGKRKVALARETSNLHPSVEKVERLQKEIYSGWKAIEFDMRYCQKLCFGHRAHPNNFS